VLFEDGRMEWPPKWHAPCRPWHPIGSTLAIVVISWWLLLGGALIWVLSEPLASAMPTPVTAVEDRIARIHHPGPIRWAVPVNRAAFDAFQRGTREGNQTLIHDAYELSEWIEATHGRAVRIVTVDGAAIQIEVLEGTYEGRRAWLTVRDLGPIN
jgi:hypothetical protein